MRVLVVSGRYPWPPRRGDQIRCLQYLELLGGRFQVEALVPEPADTAPPPPPEIEPRLHLYPFRIRDRLAGLAAAVLTGRPLQAGLFHQTSLARELRRLAPEFDVVVLLMVRLASHLEDGRGAPRLLVDFIDALSLNVKRRCRYDWRVMWPVLRIESALLARWERRMIARTDGAAVICERDRQAITRALDPELAERLSVVPLALPEAETAKSAGSGTTRPVAASRAPTLTLTGNLGYFVNRDAVTWWIDRVWPELRRRRPEVRLVVAGARAPGSLRRALRRHGVELCDSPVSLAPIVAAADVALAPLRAGSGVPIKVLEAWAAGTPVVVSRWAAAGTAGVAERDFLVADEPAEWVTQIGRLLDDPELRRSLVVAGLKRVTADHTAEVVRARFERFLDPGR